MDEPRSAQQRKVDALERLGEHHADLVRPQRVQAWREANEIAGRTIMRDGTWIV